MTVIIGSVPLMTVITGSVPLLTGKIGPFLLEVRNKITGLILLEVREMNIPIRSQE